MDNKIILQSIAVLIVAVGVGFLIGSQIDSQPQEEKFEKFYDVNLTSGENNVLVDFDNHTVELMYENSEEARFYIDKDQDGSADLRLEDTTHNGEVQKTSQIVTFGKKAYRLYFEYRDSSDKMGDGYLKLYQIKEV